MRMVGKDSMGLGAAFLVALTAGAAAQDLSSPRDQLAVWTGHWKIRIETKETQFGHAKTEDFDAKCSLLPSGTFVACEYLSLQPDSDGRFINDVSLVYYSDVDKTFKYTEVFPEGGPREGVFLIDGDVWTEPVEVHRQSGGTADGRFVFNFATPTKILARFEISLDKGAHWTLVDEFIDTKSG